MSLAMQECSQKYDSRSRTRKDRAAKSAALSITPLEALGLKPQERVNGTVKISSRGREKTRRKIHR